MRLSNRPGKASSRRCVHASILTPTPPPIGRWCSRPPAMCRSRRGWVSRSQASRRRHRNNWVFGDRRGGSFLHAADRRAGGSDRTLVRIKKAGKLLRGIAFAEEKFPPTSDGPEKNSAARSLLRAAERSLTSDWCGVTTTSDYSDDAQRPDAAPCRRRPKYGSGNANDDGANGARIADSGHPAARRAYRSIRGSSRYQTSPRQNRRVLELLRSVPAPTTIQLPKPVVSSSALPG